MDIHILYVKIQELENIALNISVWSTETDDKETVIQILDENTDLMGEVTDEVISLSYINKELRNATAEYSDDGLIAAENKSGIKPIEKYIAVPCIDTLTARIKRIDGGYHVYIVSQGNTVYSSKLSDEKLGLTKFQG